MPSTGEYAIRSARASDREQLAGMWRQFLEEQAELDARFVIADDAAERWSNDFSEWVGSKVHGFFVAESERDGLIGFASVHLWYPAPIYRPDLEAYLDEIYVRPDWRRRGAATALLQEVRSWAASRHARRIRLGVLGENRDGLTFWDRSGARPFFETLFIDVRSP